MAAVCDHAGQRTQIFSRRSDDNNTGTVITYRLPEPTTSLHRGQTPKRSSFLDGHAVVPDIEKNRLFGFANHEQGQYAAGLQLGAEFAAAVGATYKTG